MTMDLNQNKCLNCIIFENFPMKLLRSWKKVCTFALAFEKYTSHEAQNHQFGD